MFLCSFAQALLRCAADVNRLVLRLVREVGISQRCAGDPASRLIACRARR
jgi:hypothetical protein